MPRFAANLSTLFTEVPLPERFERAARAGFDAVEVQFPYDWPAELLRERLRESGLRLVLHNLPAGNVAAGERGIACDPARVDEFRAGIGRALEMAAALDAPQLNCLAGIAPAGVSEAELHRTFVANVRHAAQALRAAGRQLLIEPVNRFDVPGFWLDSMAKAIAVQDEVGAEQVRIQCDLYHLQRSQGELAATLERHLGRIGHIQFADNPGRHEPGSGEIRFPFLFEQLDRLGYKGWVGAEYLPAAGTEAGLGWLHEARAAAGCNQSG